MASHKPVYRLTAKTLSILRSFGRAVMECWYCGEPLEVGDWVYRKQNAHNSRTKMRHLKCARRLGLI